MKKIISASLILIFLLSVSGCWLIESSPEPVSESKCKYDSDCPNDCEKNTLVSNRCDENTGECYEGSREDCSTKSQCHGTASYIRYTCVEDWRCGAIETINCADKGPTYECTDTEAGATCKDMSWEGKAEEEIEVEDTEDKECETNTDCVTLNDQRCSGNSTYQQTCVEGRCQTTFIKECGEYCKCVTRADQGICRCTRK